QRAYGGASAAREYHGARRRQPPAERERARGWSPSRTRDCGDRHQTAWLMRCGAAFSLRNAVPFIGEGRETHHARNCFFLSPGTQSDRGHSATLVLPKPLPRVSRTARLPGKHQFVMVTRSRASAAKTK